MFPALSGEMRAKRTPRHTRADFEARLRALTIAEERRHAQLRRGAEERAEMSRQPLRAAVRSRPADHNAYVQLFRTAAGDVEAAEHLLRAHDPRRRCVDLVGLVPECARAIAKYEKVLRVMEDEDREFDELCKRKLLGLPARGARR